MDKLKMQSLDVTGSNVDKIARMFPQCVTEHKDKDGKTVLGIDFEKLRDELSADVIDEGEERYQFTWPDKKVHAHLANTPTTKTLRPCREESVNFDHTQNLYIEGDNLDVLKVIRETYLGKVKMIYIDPPYNTGNDFVYNDDFSQNADDYQENSGQFDEEGNHLVQNTESNGRFHTDWLNMIYPRLKVAKDLLSEDGVIFISIDDNEQANLKKNCDEVFGESNFVANLIWEKKKKPSFLNSNLGTKTDYILCYSKDRTYLGALSVDFTEKGKKYPINNAGNSLTDLTFPPNSVKFNMNDGIVRKQDMSEGNIKTILLNDFLIENHHNKEAFTLRGEWRYSQKTLNEIISNGDEILVSKIPFRPNHVKSGGEIKKMHNLLSIALYPQIGTNEDATSELTSLFGFTPFDYAKPRSLVEFLIRAATYNHQDSFILDFFSGSATTAHAVMQLNAEDGGNRKFIMVQLPEKTDEKSEAYKAGYKNICAIGKERIRRAGKKIKEENADKEGIDKLDIGFRVLKLDSSNMQDVYYTPKEFSERDLFADNVKPDRTAEDLLFQVMLDLGVELSATIEQRVIDGKQVFFVNDNYLVACFDENIAESTITEIAKMKPYYFVMRDSSLASDNVADNFDQLFETYSKDTIRKII